MPVSVKAGGAWKSLNKAFVKVGGVWKEAQVYVKAGGVWRQVTEFQGTITFTTVDWFPVEVYVNGQLAATLTSAGQQLSVFRGDVVYFKRIFAHDSQDYMLYTLCVRNSNGVVIAETSASPENNLEAYRTVQTPEITVDSVLSTLHLSVETYRW